MAGQNISPKADQPRAGTTQPMKDSPRSPNLQYRVQGVKNFERSPSTRTYGRTVRG